MFGKLFRGLSTLIVILSALNTGVAGITNNSYNIFEMLFGAPGSYPLQICYIIVGVAGAACLFFIGKGCCKSKHGCCQTPHTKD